MAKEGPHPSDAPPPFRELARRRLVAGLGEPEVLASSSGNLHRWVIKRKGGMHAHVYITLDSPEMPDIAHVLVSDPGTRAVSKITDFTMRTLEEVDALIEQILRQVAE